MFAEVLRRKLAGVCELPPGQVGALRAHYELLIRWNKVVNLTRVAGLEEAIERHYCESIFAAMHLPESGSIADVGSGAGFPGVPIAIVRPDCAVALIESHQRKAAFLREAARGVANLRVIARRAEEVEERFDWVVSRAVRYSDIAEALQKLGQNAELLTGELHVSDLAGFRWQDAIPMPWGDRRYLLLGTSVSRETNP